MLAATTPRSAIPLHERLLRWWFDRSEQHVLLGIRIGLSEPTPQERAVWLPKLETALGLIRKYDSRRFARLEKDIDGVFIFDTVGALGTWVPSVRLIKLRQTYVSTDGTSPAELASTLVHEGTHAWLDR